MRWNEAWETPVAEGAEGVTVVGGVGSIGLGDFVVGVCGRAGGEGACEVSRVGVGGVVGGDQGPNADPSGPVRMSGTERGERRVRVESEEARTKPRA